VSSPPGGRPGLFGYLINSLVDCFRWLPFLLVVPYAGLGTAVAYNTCPWKRRIFGKLCTSDFAGFPHSSAIYRLNRLGVWGSRVHTYYSLDSSSAGPGV